MKLYRYALGTFLLLTCSIILLLLSVGALSSDRYSGPTTRTVIVAQLNNFTLVADNHYEARQNFASQDTSSCRSIDSVFTEETGRARELLDAMEHKGFIVMCHATPTSWSVSVEFKGRSVRGQSGIVCADSTGFLDSGSIQSTGLCADQEVVR